MNINFEQNLFGGKKSASGTIGDVSFIRLENLRGDWMNFSQLIGYDENGTNITKGRQVSVRQTEFGTRAETAVDGSESPRGHPNQYHGGHGTGQFFEVRLDRPTAVKAVKILNRQDCCQDRMDRNVIKFLNANRQEIWVSPPLTGAMEQTVRISSGDNLPPISGCEGESARIQCPPGKRIRRLKYKYGKWEGNGKCGNNDSDPGRTMNKDVEPGECVGRENCNIGLGNNWGDPWGGVRKQWEVTPVCE